ncbi:hypothetical protein WN943_018801 [Citrus x changshan-huyou]
MAFTKMIQAAFLLLMATSVLRVDGKIGQEKVVSLGGDGFSKTHKVEWGKPNPEEGMDVDYYKKWASSRNFTTGDTIGFAYNNRTDNVKLVQRREFESCNRRTRPIKAFNTGSHSIHLKFRSHYFLSDFPGHREAGQKLEVVTTDSSLPRTPTNLPHPHVDPNIVNIGYPVYVERVVDRLRYNVTLEFYCGCASGPRPS